MERMTAGFPQMQHSERLIKDEKLIAAILDRTQEMQYAVNTEFGIPYIVNTNFGYYIEDGVLKVYLHMAKKGFKLDSLLRDNRLCLTAHLYRQFKERCEFGVHTYASVVAFGRFTLIDHKNDKPEFIRAMRSLLKQTHTGGIIRAKQKEFDDLLIGRVDCLMEDVFGKSEHPVTIEELDERFGLK